ncbi:MAG: hypothetical protein ACLQBD_31330 [Syntrophobacteraceae bacterium]
MSKRLDCPTSRNFAGMPGNRFPRLAELEIVSAEAEGGGVHELSGFEQK